MNRNVESRFALAPNVNIPRSVNDSSFKVKTTWNVGQLIPLMWDEILPGQSVRLKLDSVVRLQPLVTSPMDDLYFDTYAFFIPNRLVMKHWPELCGENTTAPWVQTTEYKVPQLTITGDTSTGVKSILPKSILDYLGVPLNEIPNGKKLSFSALPSRAYALIVREFFQDQNLETPVNVATDDTDRNALSNLDTSYGENDVTYLHRGAYPYIANRYHDYFSSCTPGPTKSISDVLAFPDMPVITTDFDETDLDAVKEKFGVDNINNIHNLSGISKAQNTVEYLDPVYVADTSGDQANHIPFFPTNLSAISGVTINDLRNAFAVQRLLERDLYGTRYRSMLKAHFGVTLPDNTAQVPEYLGGSRNSLRISQILQTSETATTPQGNVAGYSLTSDTEYMFDKSFSEFGIIMVLGCVRYKNSYQNGLQRRWTRKTRFDFYYPEMAALGNQPVFKKELYADGSAEDDKVFGYNEAWASYRFHEDLITAEMRSNFDNSLDSWHFGDDYDSHPSLSRDWMKVNKANVDRTLAVSSSVSNQLFGEFLFDIKNTLPMPLYSIPGLNGTF